MCAGAEAHRAWCSLSPELAEDAGQVVAEMQGRSDSQRLAQDRHWPPRKSRTPSNQSQERVRRKEQAGDAFPDPYTAAPNPNPVQGWHGLGSQPAGPGWQAGWHRLGPRQMEQGGGLTRNPPGNGWDCLFFGALPPPHPPTPPPTSCLWEHGWAKNNGQNRSSALEPTSLLLLLSWLLSLPTDATHCLAWLRQRP